MYTMYNEMEHRAPRTIFYSPGYQFATRLTLGTMGAIYLYFIPAPDFVLASWQILGLVFLYFSFHVLWWIRFRRAGVSESGIRLANSVDLLAGGIMVVVDPFPIPVSLLLILITVLGNGFQHGLANFIVVARSAAVVLLVVIPLHFLLIGRWPPYHFYFYLSFILVCALYAHALFRRIEDLKNRAEALAQTDELTGLLNRRAFIQSARYLVSLFHRTRMEMVFVYVDLDGFKAINDTLGHEVGDKVLKGFADLIKLNFRKTDIAARYGGDEFIFIFTDSLQRDAKTVMNRIEKQFSEWGASLGLNVGISWGMRAVSEEPVHLETILREADQALYAAKKKKRGLHQKETG